MTNVVKGAGRKRYAAQQKKHEQRSPVTGGKRDDVLKAAAEDTATPVRRRRAAAKKTAAAPAAKSEHPTAPGNPIWNSEHSLGGNTNRLREAGMTWKQIGDLAEANIEGLVVKGGTLLRAQKQFLAGTEGKERPARRSSAPKRAKVAAVNEAGEERAYSEMAAERFAEAVATRRVPWEDSATDAEVLDILNGKTIEFVSEVSGNTTKTGLVRNSKHLKMSVGAKGRYVTFVSTDGPFMNISLSRIIRVL